MCIICLYKNAVKILCKQIHFPFGTNSVFCYLLTIFLIDINSLQNFLGLSRTKF